MIDWVRSGFQAFYAESPVLAIASFAAGWLLLGLPVFFWLKAGRDVPRADAPGRAGQEQKIVASPGATAYQVGRDLTVIHTAPAPPPPLGPQNWVRNGGFESGTASWGTGYLEDMIKNGHYPEDLKRLPYVVGDKPNTSTDSSGSLDTSVRHGDGLASFRFDHKHPKTNHHYGSLAQRVHGLSPNTYYVVKFWVRTIDAKDDTFFVTTDMPWAKRSYIPPGTYDWKEWKYEFNTGPDTYVDLRFVVERPSTIWIDDVSLTELVPSTSGDTSLKR